MSLQNQREVLVLIMAGGLGKRMNSQTPKVLHHIFEKPMIVHVIEQAERLDPYRIGIIVGQYREKIKTTIDRFVSKSIQERLVYIDQPEALGTGHAIQCSRDFIKQFVDNNNNNNNDNNNDNNKTREKNVLVLSGDVPLISAKTMRGVLDKLNTINVNDNNVNDNDINECPCSIITSRVENPHGYGRIITDDRGRFQKITEEKDCTEREREIKHINAGIYAFDATTLYDSLPYITNNNSQKEYYLTDIIQIIRENKNDKIEVNKNMEINKMETTANRTIGIYTIPREKNYEITGINTRFQLQDLERQMNREL